MANDRAAALCNICGKFVFVGKYYPNCFGCVDKPALLGDFINKHVEECQLRPLEDQHELGYELCVTLENETSLARKQGGVIDLSKRESLEGLSFWSKRHNGFIRNGR